jgi:multiple sugar transport system permease protein
MSALDDATVLAAAKPRRLRASLRRNRDGTRRDPGRSFLLTLLAVVAVAAFLSPLARSVLISLQTPEQVGQLGAPWYPASPRTYEYNGKTLDVYVVPIDGATRELALAKKGRTASKFIDPVAPDAGLIEWQGSWRELTPAWQFDPHPENFANVWNELDFPRLVFNTIAIAVIGMIGTIVSCTVVAYGFSRFRFPGRDILFMLVIATIFLPSAVTIIPTYAIFVKLGWVGTWLPLLVPTFFANAFDIFLLRQYFMTIPREMDESAAIDGAGPVRTLVSVLVPQAWPVIITVAIFHLVYSWNDFFAPLIYLSSTPDLQTIAVGLARFSGARVAQDPGLIQAGTLMTLVIPVVLFLIFQRVFVRGTVITGVEK